MTINMNWLKVIFKVQGKRDTPTSRCTPCTFVTARDSWIHETTVSTDKNHETSMMLYFLAVKWGNMWNFL